MLPISLCGFQRVRPQRLAWVFWACRTCWKTHSLPGKKIQGGSFLESRVMMQEEIGHWDQQDKVDPSLLIAG